MNPFDPACIPGGSSSGSAVALADGEVDIALGQRHGRLDPQPVGVLRHGGPQDHVGPRSRSRACGRWRPSLDTVGPMARDVAGVIEGMALLEPGFAARRRAVTGDRSGAPARRRPGIDAAVDAALAASELEVVEVDLPGWDAAGEAGCAVMFHEYWVVDHHLYEQDAAGLGDDIVERMEQGRDVTLRRLPSGPRPPRRVAGRAGRGLRAGAGAGVAHPRHVPHPDRRAGPRTPAAPASR